MRFCLCIFLCFCLGFPLLFAETTGVAATERAFQDPLKTVLLRSAEEAVREADTDEEEVQALVDLALTRIQFDDVSGAESALKELPRRLPDDLEPLVRLLQADVSLLKGDPEQASKELEDIEAVPEAWKHPLVLLQSRILYLQEGLEAALLPLNIDEASVPTSHVLQAVSFLEQSNEDDRALSLLQGRLEGGEVSEQNVEAFVRLARVLSEKGESEAAMEVVDSVVEFGTRSKELELALYPVLIHLFEEQGEVAKAADMISAFTSRVEDPSLQTILHGREAHYRIQAGELEEMDRKLGEWIALYGDEPSLAVAQLSLARAWTDQGQMSNAIQAYERHNSVFTDEDLLLDSFTGLAEAQMAEKKYEEASLTAKRARERLQEADPREAALLFIEADAALRLGDPTSAAALFESWLGTYMNHEERSSVLLRASEAFSLSDQMDRASLVLNEVRNRYPDSEEAETALLQQAILLGPRRVEQALGAFDAYLEAYPKGRYIADAMTEKGIAAYRLGLFDLAIREFTAVEEFYPDHPRAEQATCLKGWATYLKGDDLEARLLGEAFLQKYPESEFEPDVRMWLAEMAYNRAEYDLASREFQVMTAESYSESLRARAGYLAGRAYLADQKVEEALVWFESSLTLDPESSFAPEVLFYLGDALTELDRFDEAIVRFEQVLKEYPGSYLAPAAQGRVGDCQYTLGEENEERYEEALNTYRQVMEATATPLDLRLQATYKTGRALAALGRLEEAQELFLEAVAGFSEHLKALPLSSRIWFVRSVTDAAQYYESLERYRDAIRIYRKLASTNVEGAAEALRRIEDLRREHLILF